MDFEGSIYGLATILSKDAAAVKENETIYAQLKLSEADLIAIKQTLHMEGVSYFFKFFRNMLSKWHGRLGSKATVQGLVKELEEVGELEPCIEKICTKFNIQRQRNQELPAPELPINLKTDAPKYADFSMTKASCNRVKGIIDKSHGTVIRDWNNLKEDFLSKASDISVVEDLLRNRETGDAIRQTFEFWIASSESNTHTFKTMVSIFRGHDCVQLAEELEKKVTYIRLGTTE